MSEIPRGGWFTPEQVEQNRREIEEALRQPPPPEPVDEAKVAADAAAAAKKALKDARIAYGQTWVNWQEQCRQRKEWIAGKQAEWRKRLKEREAAIEQWDAYVKQAADEYRDAKDTEPPARPV